MMGDARDTLIQSVRNLPEQPDVVVLVEREDPEERATLIADGCLAILNHTLEDETLKAGGAAGEILREIFPVPTLWYGVNYV